MPINHMIYKAVILGGGYGYPQKYPQFQMLELAALRNFRSEFYESVVKPSELGWEGLRVARSQNA